ncbi:hypothetical protein [Streptomyces sp. NPDC091219]|uniref:hypothetical protein n=1 Tax=Streptomyces sp. NPDC091219 TaxID=3155193 RepID=UPI00344EF9BE
MPRGRHRHSPPLHRLLPPSAIAGVSLVCAFGPWVFSQPAALRIVAAVAAATALVGAAFMRRWDTQAGKQVADLIRARTSDEWRYEERLAELESDLDESRELRVKLEHKLRAKRTELAGLRNEHAALLRRYATAETERASALEGRRLLEIEAAEPARALPPVPVAGEDVVADVEPEFEDGAPEVPETDDTEAVAASVAAEDGTDAEADTDTDAEDAQDTEDAEPEAGEVAAAEEPAVATVFSPEGSKLFLRAKAALGRRGDDGGTPGPEDPAPQDPASKDAGPEESAPKDSGPKDSASAAPVSKDVASKDAASKGEESAGAEPAPVRADGGGSEPEAAQEDEAEGKPEAVDGHEHAAAVPRAAHAAQPAQSAQPSGHFTVPTAVAVVPAAPVRRPMVEGGFDFFGMQKGATTAAMDAVQNEDLADVVGQEALAVHKAEAEAQFKPADERSRDVGVGQVIDLTAHDETEQINLHGLRSAAS